MNPKTAEVLKELEEIRTHDNPRWNIPRESGLFLNTLVKTMSAKRILEIGTSNGYSGIWLAEGLKATGGKLVTVESHGARFEEAKNNFARAEVSEYVEQVLGHAPEAVANYDEKFDIIFLDATKNETIDYFTELSPKLRQYGLIITDNTTTHAAELADFIQRMESSENFQNTLLTIGNGFLVSLKITT